jgi:light-regulated signal transduction histidine kinase (bacteriophytochrome)
VQTREDKFTCVDMNRVLEKVRQNFKVSIEKNGSTIKSENLPTIRADENQMIQLLQNLVDNAIKFCNGSPEIRIDCKTIEGFYVFSVKDK